jgi:hypothetical protein
MAASNLKHLLPDGSLADRSSDGLNADSTGTGSGSGNASLLASLDAASAGIPAVSVGQTVAAGAASNASSAPVVATAADIANAPSAGPAAQNSGAAAAGSSQDTTNPVMTLGDTFDSVSVAGGGLHFNNDFTGTAATDSEFQNDVIAAERTLATFWTNNDNVDLTFNDTQPGRQRRCRRQQFLRQLPELFDGLRSAREPPVRRLCIRGFAGLRPFRRRQHVFHAIGL